MKLKSLFKILTSVFVFAISVVGSNFLLSQTSTCKIDQVVNKLNDTNKHDYYNDFQKIKVRMTKKDISNTMICKLYNSTLIKLTQQRFAIDVYSVVSTKTSAKDLDITLFSQPTFSVTENKDKYGGYTLDWKEYTTYYGYKDMEKLEMVNPRFDADGFVFISDTYADKLLEKYNLTSYDDLMFKEEYNILPIINDETGEEITRLSINNIIYSKYIYGPITLNLYNDFGIATFGKNQYDQPKLKYSLDFSLKADAYGNAKAFKLLAKDGFNFENCDFDIQVYDYQNKEYVVNTQIADELKNAFDSKLDVLFFILGFALFVGLVVVSFLFLKKVLSDKEQFIFELVILGMFTVYGLVLNFVNVPWILSVVPILSTISIAVLVRGIVSKLLKKQEGLNGNETTGK